MLEIEFATLVAYEIVDELKLGDSIPLLKLIADKFALLEYTVKDELLPALIFDVQLEAFRMDVITTLVEPLLAKVAVEKVPALDDIVIELVFPVAVFAPVKLYVTV
jgi:hypothetical protein